MFCSKCGNELPIDSIFCPKCGNKIEKEQSSQKSEENRNLSDEKLESQKKSFEPLSSPLDQAKYESETDSLFGIKISKTKSVIIMGILLLSLFIVPEIINSSSSSKNNKSDSQSAEKRCKTSTGAPKQGLCKKAFQEKGFYIRKFNFGGADNGFGKVVCTASEKENPNVIYALDVEFDSKCGIKSAVEY